MKKKWIIPAIIAVVLVVIVSLPLLESWERTHHIEIRMHFALRCSRAWKLFRARNYTRENISGTVAMHIRQQRVCKMRSRKNLFMYLHNMSFLLTLINDVQFSSKTTHSTAMRYQSMLLQLPTLIDRATTRMENRLRYYL